MTMRYLAEGFSQHLDSAFSVAHAEGRVELILAEVRPIQSTPHIEQFSLLLQGPASPRLEQGTYTLGNEKTGPLDLFLVPVAQNEAGIVYEVVFNQLRQPD
jgi:hypothetical protein